jgi:S1-C subfamily serine protease
MHHSDANDQSTGPFESVYQTPWQGPEGELYQEEGSPEEEPYQRERQPDLPMGNIYGPEAQFYQSLGDEPVRAAWQEHPPLWHTAGKLSVPQPVKRPVRRSQNVAILALTMVIASVFGVGLFAGWTFSQNSILQSSTNSPLVIPSLAGNSIEAEREAAIAKVKPAVVQVNVTGMTYRGPYVDHASGVVVDSRGYIVTNNHVVQGGQSIEVVFADGNKVENVQVAGTDPVDDLAVLKIDPPANLVVATLGDSSKLQVGEDVVAVGNPLGDTETVTHGIISALNRSKLEHYEPMAYNALPNTIQTDAPINPGNGGGALADLQGNVIGIPTLIQYDPSYNALANGVGFAIPINQVKLIVPQIIEDGVVTHTSRAALDIMSETIDSNVQYANGLALDHGVFVTDVYADGPAAQAGLQVGDVIVAINGKEIDDEDELADVLATKSPGDKVSVSLYRGDQPMTVNVTLGELAADDYY